MCHASRIMIGLAPPTSLITKERVGGNASFIKRPVTFVVSSELHRLVGGHVKLVTESQGGTLFREAIVSC